MARLGHSSPRAALIYQHATRDRDKSIAQGLGKLIADAQGSSDLARIWPTRLSRCSAGPANRPLTCESGRR